MTRPPRIGIVGTFDVANYGDVLFPELAAAELGARLGSIELRRYSYRRLEPPDWPYPLIPVQDLPGDLGMLDLLLVGGGHLVRFDKQVAPDYLPTDSRVHHPTGYWLVPAVRALAAGVPVVWNAVGASADLPAWADPLLVPAFETADLVAVRDALSADAIAARAPRAAIVRTPDTAFGLGRWLRDGPAEDRAREIRSKAGIDRPYLIVQPSTRLRPATAAIRNAIDAARARGLQVVALPISPILGDGAGALELPADEMTFIDTWPAPMTIATLIAGAEAVVAHSLHLSITALVAGIPVFRLPPPAATKYEHVSKFGGVSLFEPSGAGLAEMIRDVHRGPVGADVQDAARLVHEHWDRVATIASAAGDRAARRRRIEAVGGIVDGLPGRLEQQAIKAADALEREHDELRRAREVVDRRDAEIVHLRHNVAAYQDQSRTATARIKELTREVEGLRRVLARRSVRLAMAVATSVRHTVARVRPRRADSRAIESATDTAPTTPPRIPATAAEEEQLRQLLLADAPGDYPRSGPLVSIVIVNRDGEEHLRRCLPAVLATDYRDLEIIFVDNGSTDGSVAFVEGIQTQVPTTVIRNAVNETFSVANNLGAAASSAAYLMLLNNDAEPVHPGWLGHMVRIARERGAAAVGARLVYPSRPAQRDDRDAGGADLTIQHRGVHFSAGAGIPRARNMGVGEDPRGPGARAIRPVPAATAACLLVDRAAFHAVGGFTDGYRYGTEDVDLCMKLRDAGGTIVYDGEAVLWHHEFGTQNAEGHAWKRTNRQANRELFLDLWGPRIFRETLLDQLHARHDLSDDPLHIGLTVTRDDAAAGFGDWFTAHELGGALERLGYRVSYLERQAADWYADHWYQGPTGVQVVIALLDAFDVRHIPRGVVTMAWIRNWAERWITHEWFDDFDIVAASSERIARLVQERTSQVAIVMPLATNPERFRPDTNPDGHQSDVVFVGSHWGEDRGVVNVLASLAGRHDVRLYGKGWEDVDLVGPFARGMLDYDQVPAAYAATKVLLDDAATSTRIHGSVNSRVFDGLAAGTLVVSDNELGIAELFDDDFPVARDEAHAVELVERYLAEPEERARVVERYRAIVLAQHTYVHRAAQVRDALVGWASADRFGLYIGVPRRELVHEWGDYHFARGLQRQLVRAGRPTRVHLLPEWTEEPAARDDVVIHLFGLSHHEPRPAQVSVLWNISHPELVDAEMCDAYDLALIASDRFAAHLARDARVPVVPLHQATDPDRFHPDPTGPAHDLLFVGNSRGVRRTILDDLMPTEFDLAVFGGGWTPDLIDPAVVRGDHVSNDELHRYYSSAAIVLNDHWPDMRANGFVNNRLYDALASGAFVISDHVDEIDAEFDGTVVTYRDPAELKALVARYVADPEARRSLADRGRSLVLERHTFKQRVESILTQVEQPLAARRTAGRADAPGSAARATTGRTTGRPRRRSERASAALVPLAPMNLRLAKEPDTSMLAVGREQLTVLREAGFRATSSILEIGCGPGRLASAILRDSHFTGRYAGFDILRRQVAWCQEYLAPLAADMTFHHADVRHPRYNPKGRVAVVHLPWGDSEFEYVVAFGTFAHLHRADIARYLEEMARVLRGDGRIIVSGFFLDERRPPREAARAEGILAHVLDAGTRYADPEEPLRQIGHATVALAALAEANGIVIADLRFGTWAGGTGSTYMDTIVMRRRPR